MYKRQTYGNINASDSLYAIKTLVFDRKRYTLEQLNEAALHDFKGHERIQKDLLKQDKYGNDKKECDEDVYKRQNEICGLKQDMEKGPWLVFESENNTVCKEAGMCPAMDEVVIEDGDAFTFKLISSFE